jgi:hypothetical protein
MISLTAVITRRSRVMTAANHDASDHVSDVFVPQCRPAPLRARRTAAPPPPHRTAIHHAGFSYGSATSGRPGRVPVMQPIPDERPSHYDQLAPWDRSSPSRLGHPRRASVPPHGTAPQPAQACHHRGRQRSWPIPCLGSIMAGAALDPGSRRVRASVRRQVQSLLLSGASPGNRAGTRVAGAICRFARMLRRMRADQRGPASDRQAGVDAPSACRAAHNGDWTPAAADR